MIELQAFQEDLIALLLIATLLFHFGILEPALIGEWLVTNYYLVELPCAVEFALSFGVVSKVQEDPPERLPGNFKALDLTKSYLYEIFECRLALLELIDDLGDRFVLHLGVRALHGIVLQPSLRGRIDLPLRHLLRVVLYTACIEYLLLRKIRLDLLKVQSFHIKRLIVAWIVAGYHGSQEGLLLVHLKVLYLVLVAVEGWDAVGVSLGRPQLLLEALVDLLTATIQNLLLQNLQSLYLLEVLVDPILSAFQDC